MKTFQRLCAGAVLMLAFTMPAFAEGHMGTPRTEPPPPAPSSITMEGDMDCPITPSNAPDESTVDSITETVWELVEGVLALF